jgi:dCTP deaminase
MRPAMPVLSDRDIVAAMDAGRLRVEGFRPENLTPNGYDLTIGEVAVLLKDPVTEKSGVAQVPPLSRFAVSTAEVVELGGTVTASLWLRTTWIRRGVVASFGKIDAGFRGTLTLGAFNADASASLAVPIGERFAQVVFEDLTSPAEKTYGERSGHYQDQRGVRLR